MLSSLNAIGAAAPSLKASSGAVMPADSTAVAQFEHALVAPTGKQGVPAIGEPRGTHAGSAPPVSAPQVLGDRMLARLQQVSDSLNHKWTTLSSIGSYQGPTMSNVLQLQLDVAQFTLQTEMLGKISGKAPQQLDQLLRMQ